MKDVTGIQSKTPAQPRAKGSRPAPCERLEPMSGREIIHNPKTGETLTVLASDDEVFSMELSLAPHGAVADVHIHPFQQQTLAVVSGTLHCKVGEEVVVIRPGESCEVPAGTAHDQQNRGDSPVRAIETYRPPQHIHMFFRVLFAFARDGLTDDKGKPPILLLAALVSEFADSVLPGSPVERFAIKVLAPVARLFGKARIVREYIARYSDPTRIVTGRAPELNPSSGCCQ